MYTEVATASQFFDQVGVLAHLSKPCKRCELALISSQDVYGG